MLKRENGESSTSTREVGVQVKSTTVISLQKKVTTLNTETQTPNLANDDSYEAALLRGHPLPVRRQFRFYMNDKSRERKFQSMSDRFKELADEDDEDALVVGAEETCIMRSQPKKNVKRALRTAKVAPTVGGKPVVPKPCTASLPESADPYYVGQDRVVKRKSPDDESLCKRANVLPGSSLLPERGVECVDNSKSTSIAQSSDRGGDNEDFTDFEEDETDVPSAAKPTSVCEKANTADQHNTSSLAETTNPAHSSVASIPRDKPESDKNTVARQKTDSAILVCKATKKESSIATQDNTTQSIKPIKKPTTQVNNMQTLSAGKHKTKDERFDETKQQTKNIDTMLSNHQIHLSKSPPAHKSSSPGNQETTPRNQAIETTGKLKKTSPIHTTEAGAKRKIENLIEAAQQINENKNKKTNRKSSQNTTDTSAKSEEKSKTSIAKDWTKMLHQTPHYFSASLYKRAVYAEAFIRVLAKFNLGLAHEGIGMMERQHMHNFMVSKKSWDVVVASYNVGVLSAEQVVAVFTVYKNVEPESESIAFIRERLKIPLQLWRHCRQQVITNGYFYQREVMRICGPFCLDNQWVENVL